MNDKQSSQIEKQRASVNIYQFLKYLAIGFSIVSFFTSIAIIGYILVTTKNQRTKNVISPTIIQPSPTLTPIPKD